MLRFEDIVAKVQTYRPGEDLGLLRRAYEFTAAQHQAQKRLSGEPYLSHPLEVVNLLADMRLDVVCLAAGMLHDVVEDTPITIDQLRKDFGPEVARIVEGVTKIGRIHFTSPEEQQAENFRKMVLAIVDDVRVILVKLADRLHNMRTLQYLPADKIQRIARETLDIYAPIAHRLGMGKIRGELEDLAFGYLEPEAYVEVKQAVESRRKVSEEFLAEVKAAVQAQMKAHSIPARLEGRIKRLYSIWQKLKRQHIPADQVYDLLALRIVTDTIKNCYAALGVIHNTWRPVPGRIKDFIAIPRPNFYQSLHTTVIGPHGQPFEVQLRTEEMHRVAEVGIAAHWKYKEGQPQVASDEERFAWLRHILEWQHEVSDPGEFLSTLKIDLYPEEVYTFTPKGKVIVLPREATPIDFAYAIHTEVGHSCVGAKVNSRIVPLKSHLRNGDIVEIITQANHAPSRDWLALVKTSRARNKIKHYVNIAQRLQAIEIGKKAAGKRGSQTRDRPQADHRGGLSARGARLWVYAGRRPLRRAGLRKIRGAPSAGQVVSGGFPGGGANLANIQRGASRPRAESRPRHSGARSRRPDGLSRQVLQPGAGRRDYRLHHPRPGYCGALPALPERAESDVRLGAPHRSRVGRAQEQCLRGEVDCLYRGPQRIAGGRDRRHQRPAM